MSDQHAQKQAAAKAALSYIEDDMILGVGTGSTVNCLIELLPTLKLAGAVASSQVTEDRLRALGIEIVDLNFAGMLDVIAFLNALYSSLPICAIADFASSTSPDIE